ncbi:MAG: zf-HC2 domain-containing protein [Acidobacteria bacterium]|nr:zf-HC2 domain-containing protein [Acidobacteriota bacterium]
MIRRGAHPEPEQLVAWLDGELPFLRRSRVDRHLRDCRVCRAQVASLESTVGDVRQSIMKADERHKLDAARARWQFREAIRNEEQHFHSTQRTSLFLVLVATAAAFLLVYLALPESRHPLPVNNAAALAGIESLENAGYASAIREDRFEAEISSSAATPVRREFRVWSAPAQRAYAVRGHDPSGTVRLAVYAPATRNPAHVRPALYRAVSDAPSHLDALESAFWTWLRQQVWEPVSFARETAEFASREGVRLTVEKRGNITVWRAEQTAGHAATMQLEIGPDRMPHSMLLSWGGANARSSIRITRLGRVNHSDFQSVAAHFRPDVPRSRPPLESAVEPVVTAVVPVDTLPHPLKLRAAEVQAVGVLHRIQACVTGELQVVRTDRAIVISGIVATEDRRLQLHAMFDPLSVRNLIEFDLRTPPATITAPPGPHTPARNAKSHPAPGEKWLRHHLKVTDEASHRKMLEAMNRLVDSALTLSSDGWALHNLAERFPEESARELAEPERRLLRAIAEDHAAAIHSHTASVAAMLGDTAVPATVPASTTSWQAVAVSLHAATEKTSADLLRMFAASAEFDDTSAVAGNEIAAIREDLHRLLDSAMRLHSAQR